MGSSARGCCWLQLGSIGLKQPRTLVCEADLSTQSSNCQGLPCQISSVLKRALTACSLLGMYGTHTVPKALLLVLLSVAL